MQDFARRNGITACWWVPKKNNGLKPYSNGHYLEWRDVNFGADLPPQPAAGAAQAGAADGVGVDVAAMAHVAGAAGGQKTANMASKYLAYPDAEF